MKQKPTVVIFALIKDTKILIEKRPLENFSGQQVLIPGGKVKNESLEEALRREMLEELNITPLDFELLTEEGVPGLHSNVLKPYIIKKWLGEIPTYILDKDSHPLSWMEIDEVLNVEVKPTRKIAKHLKKYLQK